MPDLWYPGAIRHQGAHANYEAGVNRMVSVVCHYTVGINSTGTLGQDFTFLLDRDGDVHQGCPVDARVWHAGDPWNAMGPGIECEYLPGVDDPNHNGPDDEDIMTPEQVLGASGLVKWLHEEWSVPLAFYDGPRIGAWLGFINHGSVLQSGAWHTDYWPRFDWDRIVAEGAPVPAEPPVRSNEMWGVYWNQLDGTVVFLFGIGNYVALDLVGKPDPDYHLPLNEINFVGLSLTGFTVKLVSPAVGVALRKVSAKAAA